MIKHIKGRILHIHKEFLGSLKKLIFDFQRSRSAGRETHPLDRVGYVLLRIFNYFFLILYFSSVFSINAVKPEKGIISGGKFNSLYLISVSFTYFITVSL